MAGEIAGATQKKSRPILFPSEKPEGTKKPTRETVTLQREELKEHTT
jgi:hypothetical protein